jgi:hypothetical protein
MHSWRIELTGRKFQWSAFVNIVVDFFGVSVVVGNLTF